MRDRVLAHRLQRRPPIAVETACQNRSLHAMHWLTQETTFHGADDGVNFAPLGIPTRAKASVLICPNSKKVVSFLFGCNGQSLARAIVEWAYRLQRTTIAQPTRLPLQCASFVSAPWRSRI